MRTLAPAALPPDCPGASVAARVIVLPAVPPKGSIVLVHERVRNEPFSPKRGRAVKFNVVRLGKHRTQLKTGDVQDQSTPGTLLLNEARIYHCLLGFVEHLDSRNGGIIHHRLKCKVQLSLRSRLHMRKGFGDLVKASSFPEDIEVVE
jgi:hypothetical protein